MIHPALTTDHEAFRDTVRRFVAREILPHAAAWDETETFPRELYRKARVMQIGGGSTEIMKDLAARQLGWQP